MLLLKSWLYETYVDSPGNLPRSKCEYGNGCYCLHSVFVFKLSLACSFQIFPIETRVRL